MDCIEPIVLGSGLVVPCGKCELCLSHRRSEWSVRIQLHADSYEKMPLFVTLTYDNDHLSYGDDGQPTLCRSDLQLFIKRYKDVNKLYNTDFTYFGCGEYGDKFHRPHYHLIIFGDEELYNLYDKSLEAANRRIEASWQNGHAFVCVATWAGIHYVTKYVLKENPEDYNNTCKLRPFTVASQGIGLKWLDSPAAAKIRRQLLDICNWKDEFNSHLAQYRDVETNDLRGWHRVLRESLDMSAHRFPSFKVLLPSGKYAYLPRELRRRLTGSFEHFKDNPMWYYNHLKSLCDSLEYYINNRDFDQANQLPMSLQVSLGRVAKIRQRLIINHNKKISR